MADAIEFYSKLEESLHESLKQTISSNSNDLRITSTGVTDVTGMSETGRGHMLVLTISSYCFRLIIEIIQYHTEQTEAYIADQLGIEVGHVTDDKYMDALLEFSNVLCGEFKRRLSGVSNSLGMSTPSQINKDCNKYLDSFTNMKAVKLQMTQSNVPLMDVILLADAIPEIDEFINLHEVAVEEASSGELELF